MDRFLLAENPMNDGNCAVIHTIDPVAIIECIEGHEQCATPHRQYSFVNIDGETEDWTLRVHHLMTQEFDSEQHHAIVTKLLDRAWHWYKAYMEWEDETNRLMIHEAFSKSEIAKRYYALKTGEKLTNPEAANRWRMLKNPDPAILKKVFMAVSKEQDKLLKL